MARPEITEQEKINKRVLKQNFNYLKSLSREKAKRHVKEQNEPVLEDLMNDFRDDYGNTVVMVSCEEIMQQLNE